MTDILSSTFRALATPARSQESNQFTTTVGKIIRLQARETGFRTSLKKARGALRELSDEGYIDWGPAPPGKVMLSPFNRPIVISMMPKGQAHIDDLVNGVLPPDLEGIRPKELLNTNLKFNDLDKKEKAIVQYLATTCAHNKIPYCFPSQETIVESCFNWYDAPMHRRTLNRKLAKLEAGGWVSRLPRPDTAERDGCFRRQANGKINWKFQSTIYFLCRKALAWFKKTLTMAKKVFDYFRVPSMSQYNIKPHSVILGGDHSRASPPSRHGKKVRPERTFPSEDHLLVRQALLRSQAASLLGQ